MSAHGAIFLIKQSILYGSAISLSLSALMWAFRLLPLMIWVTLPGWILSWGTIAILRGENWTHLDGIGLTIMTVGDAAFYSWICFILMRRRARRTRVSRHLS